MGQRLVISIANEGETLAKLYYHWSAYTKSALQELKTLVESVDFCTPISTPVDKVNCIMNIIRFAEENGGGIDGGLFRQEGLYIRKMFPLERFKNDDINRNYGLVAISEPGMALIQAQSEGDIIYDIGTGNVINQVYGFYENLEELRADYDDISEEDICESPYDMECFNISDLTEITNFLDETLCGVYKVGDGYVALIG